MAPCSRYLSVTGEIKNHQDKCELFIVEDGEKWEAPWSETVSGSYSVLMNIAPYSNNYALQLECPEFQHYKTEIFNAKDYSDNSYEMGSIDLVPES